MPKAIHPYSVIVQPLVTEKSTILSEQGKYAFEVDRRANKPQIKEAVELAFNVTVTDVNVLNVRGKVRRTRGGYTQRPSWKKAIVTLAAGNKIELFEGV